MSPIAGTANAYRLGTSVVDKLRLGATLVWPVTSYSSEVLADSPRWYLKLDEAASTAVDSSGNSRNGTVTGSLTHTQTPLITAGKSMTFDVNDQIDITKIAADDTANRTYEAWFSTTYVTARTVVMSRNTSSSVKLEDITVETTGIMNVRHWTPTGAQDTFNTAVNVADGNAHHVVVIMSGSTSGTCVVYLDNVKVVDSTYASNSANLPNFQIGAARSANRWIGKLDEVAYYSTALSAARVAAHYAARTAA